MDSCAPGSSLRRDHCEYDFQLARSQLCSSVRGISSTDEIALESRRRLLLQYDVGERAGCHSVARLSLWASRDEFSSRKRLANQRGQGALARSASALPN